MALLIQPPEGKDPRSTNIYDLVKAFDKLWLDDAFNELYDTVDADYKDEKLALLYK